MILSRHPLFLTSLRARGICPLLLTERQSGADARRLARMEDPEHVFSSLGEVAFVEGADLHAVLAQVRAWAERYEVRGLYCMGEVFVEPAGVAADLLGLPSPGLRATRVCRDKHLQRLYLGEWSPPYRLLPPGRRAEAAAGWRRYPAVVKPTGRHSSSGVQRVDDQDELLTALAGYPPEERLLLEARVDGREVSVESLVQEGSVVFAGVTQKLTNETDSRHFVELAHTVPCTNLTSDEIARLRSVNGDVVRRLGVQNGITHAEYRVERGGRVHLMEIAARTPGDGILLLYHLATGRPLEPELIACALREPVRAGSATRFARQVYLEHPPGRLRDVVVEPGESGEVAEPEWISRSDLWPAAAPAAPGDPARLWHVLVTKERGELLGALRDSFDRAVAFVIDAPTAADLDRLEREVRNRVTILTDCD